VGELQRVAVLRTMPTQALRQTDIARRVSSTNGSDHHGLLLGMSATRALQPQLLVGAADDPFEREAQRTAEFVISTTEPATSASGDKPIAASLTPIAQRAIGKTDPPTKKNDDDEKKHLQKAASASAGASTAPIGIESSVRTMGGGEPLSSSLRASFEPRFGYDFGGVRTHAGPDASGAAVALGARAFTVGDHIFFGPGEFRPESASGQRLIAHELAHTIQQKPLAARSARLQRDFFPDMKGVALEKMRKWADELPPYELLTVLLGRDPITDKPVERNARNFLHAALKLGGPDGLAMFAELEKNKTIERVTAWFDAEITKLNVSWEGIKMLFQRAWDALDATDIFSPSRAWEKIKAIFGPTLKRIADFAIAVGAKIVEFIKKIVLDKIAAWAKQQKGYTLLVFILGKDPVTGDAVQRTAKGFVFAVLDLVPGGDKMKENLEKSKAIEKTVAWLDAEIVKLDLTWDKIKELFRKAWDAFKVGDLLDPLGLIAKMADIFGAPLGRLLRFLGAVAKKILEFIFEGAMMIAGPIGEQIVRIVHKVGDTFNKIVEDPIGFLSNLIEAVKLGFQQFGKNIWEHLKTGLIEWLVGALEGAGVVLPKVWDLKGILDLVLQILGITYAKMRAKLVKVIGEERVAMLERIFEFIKLLVIEGPAAAWQKIVETIGSLWDMVIGGIKDWAITKIVTAAVTKLATMFNPVGAIVQAIIGIYNTVAFFVERIKQILVLVEAIVDSIANIAAGKLSQAANYVERAMARAIPVLLGFLARLIGLGDVSGAIKKVITTIQEKVDKAIDAVIAWLVEKAKGLFAGKDKPKEPPPPPQAPLTPEQAALVKAAALEEASGKLRGGRLHSVAEMQAVVDEVYAKQRPAGLRSLFVQVTDETTMAFDLVATASDPERRTLRWEDAFASDDEARGLFEKAPRNETNAALSINGTRFSETVASDEHGHAEQNLIANSWNAVKKTIADNKAKGITTTLVFAINRAPCHTRCTPALLAAMNDIPSSLRASTTFILAPTGTYEPTDNLNEDDIAAAEKRYEDARKKLRSAGQEVEGYVVISRAKLREHATRMSDLSQLSAAGWDLRQLSVRAKPTSAGVVLAEAAHKLAVKAGRVKAGA
jgi:hypothetical protein